MVHLKCSSAGVSLHAAQHHSGFEPPFSELLVETPHGVSWLGAGQVTAAVRMAVNQSPNEGKRGPWPMSDITRENFASAVAATISSVHHLYREVARLIEELREALGEEPGALIRVRGSADGKSRLNPRGFVIRDAYGVLFKPAVSDEEVDAAEDDEEDADAESDDSGRGGTGRPVELVADQPLMAVRVMLYDPRKRDDIEPQIQFGVMSDWRVGSGEATEGQRFILDRSRLRRVPLSLGAAVGIGQGRRFQTNAAVKRVEGTKHKKGDHKKAELSASSRGGDGAAVLTRQPRRAPQVGRPRSHHVGQDERRNVEESGSCHT